MVASAMPVKVFLSHASIDTWAAKQIAAHIASCEADVFLDIAQVQHGDDFETEILKAEPDCTELLVLLTPWALKRPWVLLEIGFFRHARKRIVCVLHGLSPEDLRADPNVPSLLLKLDMLDINDLDSYFAQLRARVAAEAGKNADV
jgi:hypothetical protein